MVLNEKLFELHVWYINQLTYQNTRFGRSTCIPERCGVFFPYLALYSNTFLLLLIKAKDVLKWSHVPIASLRIWFKMSFCKLSCLMIFSSQHQQVFYSGYISSHLISGLYKSCMQLLVFFQACFLIFNIRWIFSLFLALLDCVQWPSPLFHLAISFKMSSEVLIMNFFILTVDFLPCKISCLVSATHPLCSVQ